METRGVTQPSTRRRPQGPTGSTRRSAGFTLIELMIVVAIVAILASIAYPNYSEYVKRSRVADGQAKVMQVAGQLERCYTITNDYQIRNSDGDVCVDFTSLQSDEGFYNISSAGVSNSGSLASSAYSVVATASGKAPVACNSLWVDSLGDKGGSDDECW